MFLTGNHFQMFKSGSVNGRRGTLQIQTRESIKRIRRASNFTKRTRLKMAREDIVHMKNMPSNKMNIIQHIVYFFYWKYSDISFVIIKFS